MSKKIEKLNLKDDFLFAKVMSDKEICKSVLEEILKVKIKYLEIPEQQKVIDLDITSKGVRLDIYVNDDKGTVYNVEMQKTDEKNLAKRSRYYQGSIDLDLISKGEDYKKLKKSFVIFICTFDPFDNKRHLYTFNNICVEDKNLVLNDEATKIFLNTKGRDADVDDEMLELLGYIENSTDEFVSHSHSKLVSKIHEKVREVKQDPRMEVQYMTLLERDRRMREQGIEQVAKNLIAMGIDVEKIMEATGFTKEMIESIKISVENES